MKTPGKESIKVALKLFGPMLFLVLLLRVVDGRAVVSLLKTARLDMLLLSGVLFLVLQSTLTVRWYVFSRRLGLAASYRNLFEIYYAAWFLGSLPLSGTTAMAKIIYLKDLGESAARAAVSVILDKMADLAGLVLFALFGLLYIPAGFFDNALLRFLPVWASLLVATLFVCGPALRRGLGRLSARYLSRRLQKWGQDLETNLAQISAGLDLRTGLVQLLLAIVVGLLRSLVLYVLALAIGMHVSFLLIVACRAFIGVVNILPVSISGLGTRDAVLLLVLPAADVSTEAAVALGFTAFLWTVLSKFSGVIFWYKRPLPIKAIAQIGKTLFSGPDKKG